MDAALIELFPQTGMRLSEVTGLTVGDIELSPSPSPDLDNVGLAPMATVMTSATPPINGASNRGSKASELPAVAEVMTEAAPITRKGGNRDTIPVNYKACKALARCLKTKPKAEHDALFVSKFRTPMSKRAIQAPLAGHLAEAKIRDASVHTLRHTMATHHVARGTDLKTIQETLGHADLATTALYVQLAKRAQRRALHEHAL